MPATLSDEEIAIGTCLLHMADYGRAGAPLYAAAEACQARYLDLRMEAARERGEPVMSEPQPWQT